MKHFEFFVAGLEFLEAFIFLPPDSKLVVADLSVAVGVEPLDRKIELGFIEMIAEIVDEEGEFLRRDEPGFIGVVFDEDRFGERLRRTLDRHPDINDRLADLLL